MSGGKDIPLSIRDANALGLRCEPGWHGAFTREQHPDAKYSNGSRIMKRATRAGDSVRNGALGTVLGSVGHEVVGVAYFVEWDARPKEAVLVTEARIEPSRP